MIDPSYLALALMMIDWLRLGEVCRSDLTTLSKLLLFIDVLSFAKHFQQVALKENHFNFMFKLSKPSVILWGNNFTLLQVRGEGELAAVVVLWPNFGWNSYPRDSSITKMSTLIWLSLLFPQLCFLDFPIHLILLIPGCRHLRNENFLKLISETNRKHPVF